MFALNLPALKSFEPGLPTSVHERFFFLPEWGRGGGDGGVGNTVRQVLDARSHLHSP